MDLEEIKKYVPLKESQSEHCELLFVDFNGVNDNDTINPMGIGVFQRQISLTEDNIDIKKEIIKKIIELAEKNRTEEEEIVKKFSVKGVEDPRKIVARILNGSNYIAANGRIGPANTMLISEENYKKLKISELVVDNKIAGMNILFEDSVKDIIIYRQNSVDQPGLIIVYMADKQKLREEKLNRILENEEEIKYFKYVLLDIGFYPQKQFLKIEI